MDAAAETRITLVCWPLIALSDTASQPVNREHRKAGELAQLPAVNREHVGLAADAR